MSETKEIRLLYEPRQWQEQCHARRQKRAIIVLHRQGGKSEFVAGELWTSALNASRGGLDHAFLYLAGQRKQAKAIMWSRLKRQGKEIIEAGLATVKETELTIFYHPTNSLIRVDGCDNVDALRGLTLDGLALDEVAQMPSSIWETLSPTLISRKGWAVFIGTPNGTNIFSDLYFKHLNDPRWFVKHLTLYQSGSYTPEEIEEIWSQKTSENAFRREYLCDFDVSGTEQLISIEQARAAIERYADPAIWKNAPVIMGVDPARFGDDRSVIVRRQGLMMHPPVIRGGIDNMALADLVADQIAMHRPQAVFIDGGGVGSGVIDRLRQMQHQVIEVPFNGTALKRGYANRRAEMWCNLADWIKKDGGCIPNIDGLLTDLTAPHFDYNLSNNILLESKDTIKKRGLPSPDIGDALALTFAAPVFDEPRRKDFAQAAIEYHPLNSVPMFSAGKMFSGSYSLFR